MRVGKRLRHLSEDESGAVLLIIAISLITFLGFVMLVVDVGGLLTKHRQVVGAADAAALAAAQTCARQVAGEDPTAVATDYATDNVDSAVLSGPLEFSGSCNDPAGSVTVRFQAPQGLFFAPLFGWDDFTNVGAEATAIWGPAGEGGGDVVPLMASLHQLPGSCDIPEAEEGDECPLWFSDKLTGSSTFGWLNLFGPEDSKHGWNVDPGANCPALGTSDTIGWLQGTVEATTPLNWTDPTYVCRDPGNVTPNWVELEKLMGEVRLFPVNDPNGDWSAANGGTGDHGQLDSGGNRCSGDPADCPDPEKYDIVAFIALELVALYEGDDPLAVGEEGDEGTLDLLGHCKEKKTPDFDTNESLTLDFINGSGCPGGIPPDSITPDSPFVYDVTKVKGQDVVTPYTACPSQGPGCDYVWDPVAHTITWLGPNNTKDVWIEFDWIKFGEPPTKGTDGFCGSEGLGPNKEKPDGNDRCLVTKLAGEVVDGSDPEGGADLGVRPVRLCEAPDPMCPSE